MSLPNQNKTEELTQDEYTALMERALSDKDCQKAYREHHDLRDDDRYFEFALKYFKAAGEL